MAGSSSAKKSFPSLGIGKAKRPLFDVGPQPTIRRGGAQLGGGVVFSNGPWTEFQPPWTTCEPGRFTCEVSTLFPPRRSPRAKSRACAGFNRKLEKRKVLRTPPLILQGRGGVTRSLPPPLARLIGPWARPSGIICFKKDSSFFCLRGDRMFPPQPDSARVPQSCEEAICDPSGHLHTTGVVPLPWLFPKTWLW